MAFYAIEAFTSKPDLIDNPYPTAFNRDQKTAVILDIALAAIAIGVGACVLLQTKGILDLGMFSSIGAIGPQAAKVMIAAGLGLMTLDFMKMIFQYASYTNAMIALVGQMQTDLNRANVRIAQLTEQPQQVPEEFNDEGQIAPIQELQAQLHAAQEEARQVTPLRQQLEELHIQTSEIQELQAQLHAAQEEARQVTPLRQQLEELHIQTSELQEQLRAAQKLASQVPELEQRLRVLESSHSASINNLEQLDALNGAASTIIASTDKHLKDHIAELECALQEANARIQELEQASNSSILDVTVTPPRNFGPPPAPPPPPNWDPKSQPRTIGLADQIQAKALEVATQTIDAAVKRSSELQRYFEGMENADERSELLQILKEHFLNKKLKLLKMGRRFPQNALMRAVKNRRKSMSDSLLDISSEEDSPVNTSLYDTIKSRSQNQAEDLATKRWENGEDGLDEEDEAVTLEEQKREILNEHQPVLDFYMATATWYNANVPRDQKLKRVQTALDTINHLIERFDGDAND